MDAIRKLEQQHGEVVRLFGEYRLLGGGSSPNRDAAFKRLGAAIGAYTDLEAKVLYPAAKARSTAAVLPRFINEEVQLARHLAELSALRPGAEPFEQKLNDLERDLLVHAREQAAELYPRVRVQLGRLRLEELGEQMERVTGKPEGMLPS